MSTVKKADVAVLSQAIKTVSILDKAEADNFLADLFGERPEDTEVQRNSTERHKLIELLIGIEDGTEEISKADHKKVFEPFTKEQKFAYKYTAKNWKIALKLRKDNGYWRKDKNGKRVKVKFNPTTIESVRTAIRRATATPAGKTPLTQEKLVELIVDTCMSENFDLQEVARQAKDLFDSRQPKEKKEPSLPPLKSELKKVA
tara:strand:- start:870 stop:1475 length:606 start_codon:yes stop_codon:yes gene_type:complete